MSRYSYALSPLQYAVTELEQYGINGELFCTRQSSWRHWNGILHSNHKLSNAEHVAVMRNRDNEWRKYELEFSDSSDGLFSWIFENNKQAKLLSKEYTRIATSFIEDGEVNQVKVCWAFRDFLLETGHETIDVFIDIEGLVELDFIDE